MRIIFMGTPEFSVPTLEALIKEHEVIAVYTQAPKPAGRGQHEQLSPVHESANKFSIKVFTPKTLKKPDIQQELINLKADVIVVVAYGLILPTEVLNATKYGCINIHPSLLPFYRGAAPMQRTILSGEKETAMCIMKMDEGIDTGDILMMEKLPLPSDITYPILSSKMSHLGAKLLLDTLKNINNIIPCKQNGEGSYAAKISKEESELNWHESSEFLVRKVNAFNPWPGTYFLNGEEKIKVLNAKSFNEQHYHKPGTIIDQNNLVIACSHGLFQPLILQRAGKKPMKTSDFLRGYKIENLI